MEIFFKYGLACIIPQTYENIFKEHICVHGRWRPFLIYNYYNADLFDELKKLVSEHLNETATVCCIIDNDLKGENKANDILNVFEKLSAEKSFSVIGAVVTSHEKIERINENVHIEFVSKDNLELLKTALLKSIYHYLLNVFKIEMLKETDSAIKKAAAHPAVAQYLITMAQIEAISNYEIIYQWILELFEQGLSNNTHIPTLVAISNMLDECANVDVFDKVDSISDIGGFEAFDYNINKFYQPIAPGDVFINSEGRIFVLVGQACDMAMSCTRSRRNGLCELVEAKIEPITSINKKTLDNLVHMWVYNFKLDGNTSALKIDYRKRYFMENEVLSLCSFSNDGACWIDINNALPEAQKKITQQYLLDYYEKLQKYFSAIIQLKASSEENLAVVCPRNT